MSSQEDWTPIVLEDGAAPGSAARETTAYPDRNAVLERLIDHRRRRILSVLLDRSAPMPVEDLAARVAAAEGAGALGDVDPETTERVEIDLYHVHIPALADVDLVEWDREEGTVVTTDHPALADPAFRQFVETEADVDGVLDCLSDPRRRRALAVLDEEGPMTRAELAHEVATEETGGTSSDSFEDVLVGLHHVDLPKLEDAGLVECDPDAETVEYVGHPGVDDRWLGH